MTCEDHLCPKRCGQDCGECCVIVEKALPCGHTAMIKCADDPVLHKCTKRVSVSLTKCGHTQDKLCYQKPDPNCLSRCDSKKLSCDHRCQEICHICQQNFSRNHSQVSHTITYILITGITNLKNSNPGEILTGYILCFNIKV